MYKKIAAIGVVLSLMLSGCSMTGLVVRAEYPSIKERPQTVDESILQAVQEFSLETSAELLGKHSGNTLYSPLSLYYALAMTAEGAAGATREEMNTLLGVDNEENFAQNCGDLYRYLYRNEDDHVLQIANSLWMQEGVEFREEYQQQMKDNFYASLYAVDFGAQQTAEQMGKWVSEQTGSLLEYEYIPDPSRILTLLNTVWLKDAWQTQFVEAGTQDETFYHENGNETQLPFMHLTEEGTVYQGEGWTRASLPVSYTHLDVYQRQI